jgi:hypothetical protein
MQHLSSLVQHLERKAQKNMTHADCAPPKPAYPSRMKSGKFVGLPKGTSHYDVLVALKKMGRASGFSARMLDLLEYYMLFTKPIDWEQGSDTGPIIYQSIARTALDLGLSERHVQRLEKQLHLAGLLGWSDSGNHKRYGQRCARTGRILYGFGVDLSPLAAHWPALQKQLAAKKHADTAWLKAKRDISACRRACRTLLEALAGSGMHEKMQQSYEQIGLIKIRAGMKLQQLEALLQQHETLRDLIAAQLETPTQDLEKESCKDVKNVVHKESLTQNKNIIILEHEDLKQPLANSQSSIVSCGLGKISLGDALDFLTPQIKAHLPLEPKTWNDLAEAAYKARRELKISQKEWSEACGILHKNGAALCLAVASRGAGRSQNPVQRPNLYFRTLVNKARTGDLCLDKLVRKHHEKN